jgi:hypothetical protein
MKKILCLTAFGATLLFASCKEEMSYSSKMPALRDSIFAAYPSVASVIINVQNHDMAIALGSKQLAEKSTTEKQKTIEDVGRMALRIFGPENRISAGKVIITPNEDNDKPDPADGTSASLSIETLKKELGQQQ